jgi:hypothetical protein
VLFGENAPLPEAVQLPVFVTPRIVPLNAATEEVLQIVGVVAAITVATGDIVRFMVLLSAAQTPLLVEVNVKVTRPFALSAAEIE